MSAETYSSHHSQFVGVYYAIPAIGGFNIEQHFGGPIPIIVSDIPAKDLDLTLALQLRINVKTFNDKLEIVKDASNNTVISSPFDISGGSFPSPISFDFKEFIPDITSDNIISLGNFSTMNSDFRRNIVNYYKLSKDVNVFDPSGESQNTGSTITNNEFIDLFSFVDPSSNTSNDISGNMYIYYVPQLMASLYENDPFNNRSNKTIEHGFIAGDIIFLENGLSVRLDLLNESVPPISGVSEDINYDSMVILSKIYTAPLVLHLDNI